MPTTATGRRKSSTFFSCCALCKSCFCPCLEVGCICSCLSVLSNVARRKLTGFELFSGISSKSSGSTPKFCILSFKLSNLSLAWINKHNDQLLTHQLNMTSEDTTCSWHIKGPQIGISHASNRTNKRKIYKHVYQIYMGNQITATKVKT